MEPRKEANLDMEFHETVGESVEDTDGLLDELVDELLETVDERVDEGLEMLTRMFGLRVEAVERQSGARMWAWIHRKWH